MACWKKWLVPSLLTAVGMTALTGVIAFRSIEDDVVGRTAKQARADGWGWAKLTTSGRDLVLLGEAPDPAARDNAAAAADRVFGVRVVDVKASVLPEVKPFVFSLSREGAVVKLTGAVPSEAARAGLLDAISKALPEVRVEDGTTMARGASAGFGALAAFGIAQTASLAKGRIDLSDQTYSISGDPRSFAAWSKLEGELAKSLPAGAKLGTDALTVPVPDPYRVGLTVKDGKALLEGFLPDTASVEKVIAAAKAIWGDSVESRIMVAKGAPAGFIDAILGVLPGFGRFGDGHLELSGTNLTFGGSAPTAALGERIRSWIAGHLPSGFTIGGAEVSVAVPAPVAPAECRTGLTAVQTSGKIRFETGSAHLNTEDTRLLDRLVVAALRCGTAKVTIEGHTDNVGDPASNQALSEKRAAAVVAYLVELGVAADRLTSIGYGDTRPVVDNGTPEGRAQNRRIDFTIE